MWGQRDVGAMGGCRDHGGCGAIGRCGAMGGCGAMVEGGGRGMQELWWDQRDEGALVEIRSQGMLEPCGMRMPEGGRTSWWDVGSEGCRSHREL